MVMSGPIPAGSPSVKASGRTIKTLLAFDHRLLAQLLKEALGSELEFFVEDLVARLALLGSFLGRFLLFAQREQLDPLRRYFRSGQMTDLGLVEDLAQGRQQIGRALDDDVAHGDVAQA